jgi:hypothetical protein
LLLKIWKTNDRDWSIEQLSVALRIISARLAQAITNLDTRFFKKTTNQIYSYFDFLTVSTRSDVSITPKTAFPSYLNPPIKYESKRKKRFVYT